MSNSQKTNLPELLQISELIISEWMNHTTVVNMTTEEANKFFTKMLACEKYPNGDQGELWELKEAIERKTCANGGGCECVDLSGFNANNCDLKQQRIDILDALADCWYFAWQWLAFGGCKFVKVEINTDIFGAFEHFKRMVETESSTKSKLSMLGFMDKIIERANTYNFPLHLAVKEVHESNLSKRDEDGNFIYREDGKIIKSKLYKKPDLSKFV